MSNRTGYIRTSIGSGFPARKGASEKKRKKKEKREKKRKRGKKGENHGGHSGEIFAVEPTKREFITFLSRKW